MKTLKNMAPILWILIAIAVLISGIILLFNTSLAWEIIEAIVSGLIFLVGIMYILSIFMKSSENKLKNLGVGFFCLLGGIALAVFPQFIEGTFSLVAGIFGLLVGLLIFLNSLKLKSDGASWIGTLMTALIYIAFGIGMIFLPSGDRLFGLVFGAYLIFFSFNIFGDAFVILMSSNDTARKAKKHIRLSLPVVFAAFLPMKMLKKVNDLVKEEPEALLLLSKEKPQKKPDLEVYIHTREGFISGMGHVDICLGDLVYTYGNYDDITWKMGGFFADGVMVKMSRESHIQQALEVENKILMVYGLVLSEEQKKGVLEKINDIEKELLPWYPLAESCERGEIDGKPADYNDVSSQLYKNTDARFFKFKPGNPFKTYYAVGTNCVKLADTVVGHSGIDLLKINGIITPGAYLDYLDSLYERGDSIVVARRLYCKNENNQKK